LNHSAQPECYQEQFSLEWFIRRRRVLAEQRVIVENEDEPPLSDALDCTYVQAGTWISQNVLRVVAITLTLILSIWAASTEKVLYTFQGTGDGAQPMAAWSVMSREILRDNSVQLSKYRGS
jgi:hypothetical protein